MALGDLTTLATLKQWLPGAGGSLQSVADDALLTRLITAASQFIQTYVAFEFALLPYTELRDGGGGQKLAFAAVPVAAVSSVIIDGAAIPLSSGPLAPGYAFSSTMLYLRGAYCFTPGFQNIALAYTAGYATTPPEIEQACIALVALRYRERDRVGLASKTLAGETVSYTAKDMPPDVESILDQYRRIFQP
jgi:hypothetical protein